MAGDIKIARRYHYNYIVYTSTPYVKALYILFLRQLQSISADLNIKRIAHNSIGSREAEAEGVICREVQGVFVLYLIFKCIPAEGEAEAGQAQGTAACECQAHAVPVRPCPHQRGGGVWRGARRRRGGMDFLAPGRIVPRLFRALAGAKHQHRQQNDNDQRRRDHQQGFGVQRDRMRGFRWSGGSWPRLGGGMLFAAGGAKAGIFGKLFPAVRAKHGSILPAAQRLAAALAKSGV